ncbi:hypothetical protein IW15_04890 [Chryseobacterium soli]|uniref:DUF4349 domain-containing protein n=1 Tax=Chryseobacterium soli TaxID=445961 RepID=A0A086ADK7_9FLAO|nr:DUF4349 domain-containing protein [Chryseobacterium soli]KFF14771.1 hypothetical protein IW15_04890 [Chryseobacterium soli]
MKRLLTLPLFCLISMHCNKQQPQSVNADLVEVLQEDKAFENTPPPPPPRESPVNKSTMVSSSPVTGQQEPQPSVEPISKKIIKNGEISIQVGDVKKAQQQLGDILKKNKAYIQKEEYQNTDTAEKISLVIRVPHQEFDGLVNSFSDGIGSVTSKNISTNDVTEEYTDVSIRLANKKIYLEKYRNMLKTAATTKDILEIQENIRELEDEIDTSEGRLRFIDDRVDFSTLHLDLYKEKVRSSATSKIGFGSRFADSLTEGWNTFVGFSLGLIALWPFLLIIPLIIFLWKKWRSRRKNK